EAQQKLEAVLLDDPTIKARTKGVGVLTKKEALELCAVGPTARASGLDRDVRQDHSYAAYGDLGVRSILGKNGDCYDRFVVRVKEVAQSIDIVEQCLGALPAGGCMAEPNLNKLLFQLKNVQGEGVGRHEAPRGEVFHYVRMDKDDAVKTWKVKAPTYSNLLSWKPMLVGESIADVPIIFAAIDPCIACTDRVTITRNGRSEVVGKEFFAEAVK
ncbi:MAG: NADH dehydrogenase subunit, partial [Candidatus Diapherotrites archaeon]|nr:NADH dehydrogenase subunit [Candidatus Diapherotrites archaeon]